MTKGHRVVYVPALKAKRGEFTALANLSSTAKRRILPLLDVLPAPFDWNISKPAKRLEDHLDGVGAKILKCWGREERLLVDLFDIPLDERTSTGTHPILHLFSALRRIGVSAIPVTGLERDQPYNNAARQAVGWANRAVGIRLLTEDIALPGKSSVQLAKLLSNLNAVPNRSVLILDFRGLAEDQVADSSQKALASLRAAIRLAKWDATVVLASGMPDSFSHIKAGTHTEVRRTELDLWRNVVAASPTTPLFGDYGVVHPEFMEPRDPRTMKPSAKIRYTLERDWYIVKGSNFRSDPSQYRSLAAQVEAHPAFCGQGYSWGDNYIVKCQRNSGGAGNLETWVRADTSHHVEYVARQIASLLAV